MRTFPRHRRPGPFPAFYLLTAALVAAAVISAVILDHINQRKGERSYLFKRREVPAAAAPSREAPAGTQAQPQAGAEEPRPRTETSAPAVEPPPKTAAPAAAE